MKTIPIVIPKQDGTPIHLSLPKLTKLDKLARVLISTGAGLALAGVISSLLNGDEEMTEDSQSQEDDAQQPIQP